MSTRPAWTNLSYFGSNSSWGQGSSGYWGRDIPPKSVTDTFHPSTARMYDMLRAAREKQASSSTKATTTPASEPVEERKPSASFFDEFDFDYYQPQSQEKLSEQARIFRNIFEQPQSEALERRLEQAITDATGQKGSIRADFAGLEDALRRREAEQRRLDLESAVSRGGGRSGVVPYQATQRDELYTEKLTAELAKKNAAIANVRNQLALIQKQVPLELQQLAEQASRIEAQELQRLMDLDYERKRESIIDQFQKAMAVFDRTQLTPYEQLHLYNQLAAVKGKYPDSLPSIFGQFGIS